MIVRCTDGACSISLDGRQSLRAGDFVNEPQPPTATPNVAVDA
jgi:hypothetical protein